MEAFHQSKLQKLWIRSAILTENGINHSGISENVIPLKVYMGTSKINFEHFMSAALSVGWHIHDYIDGWKQTIQMKK